jgi:predicted DNA-binding transcriptional regulator YafY
MLGPVSDPSARLLKLLSLLQTPREWPGSELSARLGVSARTVRRDIERLRELGYPVEATMGAEGGYRLVAGTAMPPLLLDDEEAVAIAVGLRIASGHAVEGIDEASVRALTKLERVLPSRLRRRVGVLGAATVPMLTGDAATVDPQILTGLATAIANRERARFTYRAHDGDETKRLVEPERLVSSGRRWYLLAFDTGRDDWRIFRVDRITDPLLTGARFTPRELPAADAVAYITGKLYSSAPTYRAVATLHAPADEVTRRWGTSAGEVTPLDEHTCRLLGHADTLEWLAFRLTLLGCEFDVHSPPELAEYLRALGARVTRAAGACGPRTDGPRPAGAG